RSVADDDVELGAASAVGVDVAPCTHHPVTVREPGTSELGIAGRRKAVREANLRCIDVTVGEPREAKVAACAPVELGRDSPLPHLHGAALGGVVAVGVAPLDNVVVLRADDGESVEVPLAYESLYVGDVMGREARSELDHHASRWEIEVERVLGIERSPVG